MTSTPVDARGVTSMRMTTVREAFQQRRMAQAKRQLWLFYLEHNLFEEAREARQRMLEHLRSACEHWRRTLGITR